MYFKEIIILVNKNNIKYNTDFITWYKPKLELYLKQIGNYKVIINKIKSIGMKI